VGAGEMSNNKKLRKEIYKAYLQDEKVKLLEKKGFILYKKDRAETVEFEDQTCIGTFEISGGFKNIPYYYTNLQIESKDKCALVSNEAKIRITKLIEKVYKHPRDVFEFPQDRKPKLIDIFKSWFR
jgi:hypothetical protein